VAWSAGSVAPEPLDAQVWTAEGQKVHLRSFWGRPTVLIYEARNALEVNRTLKDALWHRGHGPGAKTDAQVLGIAALHEYDWFPARSVAEHMVRERQARVGIPVLIDWKGELSTGAWALPAQGSSVVVLGDKGTVEFRATGALTQQQIDEVFALLERLTSHPG